MQQLYRPFIFRLLLGLLAALLASTQWPGAVQAQTYPQNQITDEQRPVDYQTYSAADESFSIEIPAHWQTIKLSATTLDSGLDLLETENPQLKAFFNSPTFRQLVATGMKFYAIDLSDQGAAYALPINVNVLKLDTGVDLSLAAVKKLNERQLAALAARRGVHGESFLRALSATNRSSGGGGSGTVDRSRSMMRASPT